MLLLFPFSRISQIDQLPEGTEVQVHPIPLASSYKKIHRHWISKELDPTEYQPLVRLCPSQPSAALSCLLTPCQCQAEGYFPLGTIAIDPNGIEYVKGLAGCARHPASTQCLCMRLMSWFCTGRVVGPLIFIRKSAMCMKATQFLPPLHVPPSHDHGSNVTAYPAGSTEGIAMGAVIPASQYLHSSFPELGPGLVSIIIAGSPFNNCFKEAYVVLQPTTSATLETDRATLTAAPYLLTGKGSAYFMRDGDRDGIRPPCMAPRRSEDLHQVAEEYLQVSGASAGAVRRDPHSAAEDVSQYSWTLV